MIREIDFFFLYVCMIAFSISFSCFFYRVSVLSYIEVDCINILESFEPNYTQTIPIWDKHNFSLNEKAHEQTQKMQEIERNG